MTAETIYWIVATGLSVVGLMYGLLKWIMSTVNGRFKDHQKKFDACFGQIKENEDRVNATRDEMHKEYVHTSVMTGFAQEIRDDVGKISSQIEHMSDSLNQLIGRMSNNDTGH